MRFKKKYIIFIAIKRIYRILAVEINKTIKVLNKQKNVINFFN